MSTLSTAQARTFLALAVVCAGCSGGTADDEVFTSEERALIRTMVLDPKVTPPIDVGNDLWRLGAVLTVPPFDLQAFRLRLARFGQQLFFDDQLSSRRADGTTVACVECHHPSHWFSDPREDNGVSPGLDWTARNSPSLINVGYYVSFGWDGRADALWAQGKHAFESPATMKGDKRVLAQQVARRYSEVWRDTFQLELPQELLSDAPNRFNATPRDAMTEYELDRIYRAILQAWGAYELQLNSGDSPFDRFAMGDESALDAAQRRGLHLFLGKAGCLSCHLGPNFTDSLFHSVGVGQTGEHAPAEDLGRFAGLEKFNAMSFASYRMGPVRAATEADKGLFRTKSLRQVAQTAPYFHAGQLATLADVVWFYNQGGGQSGAGTPSPLLVPLGLSEPEQADLVAFLGALTGTPPDPGWTCNNARSPAALATTTRCAGIP